MDARLKRFGVVSEQARMAARLERFAADTVVLCDVLSSVLVSSPVLHSTFGNFTFLVTVHGV